MNTHQPAQKNSAIRLLVVAAVTFAVAAAVSSLLVNRLGASPSSLDAFVVGDFSIEENAVGATDHLFVVRTTGEPAEILNRNDIPYSIIAGTIVEVLTGDPGRGQVRLASLGTTTAPGLEFGALEGRTTYVVATIIDEAEGYHEVTWAERVGGEGQELSAERRARWEEAVNNPTPRSHFSDGRAPRR